VVKSFTMVEVASGEHDLPTGFLLKGDDYKAQTTWADFTQQVSHRKTVTVAALNDLPGR